MSYTVEQIAEDRESFAPYRYRILKNGNEFAIFTHNYRGECERIQLLTNSYDEDPPFGMSSSFLTGGGPYTLGLTKAAESYLDQLSQSSRLPDWGSERVIRLRMLFINASLKGCAGFNRIGKNETITSA